MTLDEAIQHAKEVAVTQRNNQDCIKCAEEHEQLAEWLEKLKEYQQLEEQGRLVKLPCKVGDVVYLIKDNGTIAECVTDMMFLCVLLGEFGKEWFLTKYEAEAKLKELRGGEDER